MTWKIDYVRSARKSVDKLEAQQQRRIRDFLHQRVAELEDPRQLATPLQGRLAGLWRFRVGDYRIIASLEDDRLCILVIRIAHRREVYR